MAIFKKSIALKKFKRFLYEGLLTSDLPEKEQKSVLLMFIMPYLWKRH